VQRPERLRYRVQMKRPIRKLVVRSETIRALAPLDLTRVAGGFDTGDAHCVTQPLRDSLVVKCTTKG
jgi:hypothetical protein